VRQALRAMAAAAIGLCMLVGLPGHALAETPSTDPTSGPSAAAPAPSATPGPSETPTPTPAATPSVADQQVVQGWFRWLLATSTLVSPLRRDGGCPGDMMGNVLYLPESPGGWVSGSCTIPAGVPILLVPADVFAIEGIDGDSAAQLGAAASESWGRLVSVDASVDGKPVEDLDRYYVITDPFSLSMPGANVLGLGTGALTSVGAGYFVMLPALPPGEHLIEVYQRYGFLFEAGATYDIAVER
jgi:hypothetical protein